MSLNTAFASKSRRSATLGITSGAHFLHDGFTDSVYILLPIWAEAFGLSHVQVGFLKGVASGTLAACQIPAGFLAEKVGERLVLFAGTLVAGLAYIVLGMSIGFSSLVFCLFLIGLGCSTQHPLSAGLIARQFGPGRRRVALGTYNFMGDIGKVFLPLSLAGLVSLASWRVGSMILGLAGIVGAFVLMLAFRKLEIGQKPDTSQLAELAEIPSGWGINNRIGFTSLSLIAILDNGCRAAFLTFLPFILLFKGAEIEQLGLALALTLAGGAAGKLACGFLAERLGVVTTIITTEVITGLGIFAVVFLNLNQCFILLPFLGIALNGTSSVLYGGVADFVTQERQTRAYSLFYTCGIGAAAVMPMLLGLVSDQSGVEFALILLGMSIFLVLPLCLVLNLGIKINADRYPISPLR